MSPQLNGEPREDALAATDAVPTLSADDVADSPLPVSLNTSRVTKTAITDKTAVSEEPLAPLFAQDATSDFRSRWDLVQKGFVDDPREAVHAADQLVAEVTKSLNDTFAKRRADLEMSFDRAEEPSTENLRVALRQYRSFFERLLEI